MLHPPLSTLFPYTTLFRSGAAKIRFLGRGGIYIETICLSLTAFLLMVPTVSETLRRVPDGHPFVTDLRSPLLLGAQASLLDRKSTRLNSSHVKISYAVFCL